MTEYQPCAICGTDIYWCTQHDDWHHKTWTAATAQYPYHLAEPADTPKGPIMHTIQLAIPGYGTATVTAQALDEAMERYLSASPAQLRATAKERAGHGPEDTDTIFDRVTSVSAFLVMLADWEHNTDDDPLRAY